MMRRMKICEEAGTGIDKAVEAIEAVYLPPLKFTTVAGCTRVFLYSRRTFGELDTEQRIEACYQHACLCFVQARRMTNSSLRKRLQIDHANAAQASRLIREAVNAKRIKLFDPKATRKNASYVPQWA